MTVFSPSLLEGIQAVSFDAGFTLINTEPPVGTVYSQVASRFGYHIEPQEIHSRFEKVWRKKSAENRGEKENNALADEERAFLWWKAIFKESIGDILAPGDLERMFEVCYHEYARGVYWKVYPDVEQTLSTLRSRGLRLVVLSNWDHRLRQTLEEVDLARYFEKIYISTLIGHAKPAPGAFEHIIEDLGLPGSSILHVGDTPEEDVLGAQRVGMRGVCIDRKGKHKSLSGQLPVISSLTQLS